MSRTGNFLFPENEDDGWVSSIIKALPEPQKDPKTENALDGEAIADPVAIEAEARFSELAADMAERDAISAAGWSAKITTPQDSPESAEDRFSPEALDALDAVIDRKALDDPMATGVDDPVALQAAAAFAEAAADTAARDAFQTAGWAADVRRGGEPAEGSPLPALSETPVFAAPAVSPEITPVFSPEALAALDAVLDRDDIQPGLTADVADPVAIAADAAFAETAAETIAEHAIFAAGWSAMARKPGIESGVAELTAGERKALDVALAEEAKHPGVLSETNDPVALAGDAVFSEIAADVAAQDAIHMAEWAPRPAPVMKPMDVAEVVKPEVLETLSALSASEARALDAALAEQSGFRGGPASGEDPVALEADSLFTDMAADLAIDEAVRVARRDARPDPAMVVQGDTRQQPESAGFWTIEDLVRAEAEIAFEDAAFDLAYDAVDSLVTGEAAALAAFDQAIASGADPEEALALAIAAAEEIDPKNFGLARVAAAPVTPDEGRFTPPAREGREDGEAQDARDVAQASLAEARETPGQIQEDGRPEAAVTFARVGEGFETLPTDNVLIGGTDGDVLDAGLRGFEFTLDLDLVTGAGSRFQKTERDDEETITVVATGADDNIYGTASADTLTGTIGGDNIFGYAGDDILIGGQGADTISGGAGADQFVFEGGAGADALAHATSLGTDVISDYSALDGDTFGLSNADFGFGAAGTLTDGADYFESTATLTGAAQDLSGGAAGPAIVVLGAGAGTDGVDVYYTDDASAMSTDNSYQIADVSGANTGDVAAGDFNLRV